MLVEVLMGVLEPFISKMIEQFLKRRRNAVDLGELQDQVAQLIATQHALSADAAEVRRAVAVLARYLVLSRQDVFLIRADELRLTERSDQRGDVAVEAAITDFGHLVERGIQRRHQVRANRGNSAALDGFLDGFAEEILEVRLGRAEIAADE